MLDSLFHVESTECAPDTPSELPKSHDEKIKLAKRVSQDLQGCEEAHRNIETGKRGSVYPIC